MTRTMLFLKLKKCGFDDMIEKHFKERNPKKVVLTKHIVKDVLKKIEKLQQHGQSTKNIDQFYIDIKETMKGYY